AGKTTLLKILSRITEPTTGKVTLKGRVASLLEVGTGFHPELTGRENIYLNGSILGMTRKEINRKFSEIVEFSGVEKFLDTPVKRYSSGMYVRLAFAVAAHLDPEILIVDEVLAVGDAEFQQKCLGKMRDVAKGGRTVIFVSHNMGAISSLCHRCMQVNEGSIVKIGLPNIIIQNYNKLKVNKENLGEMVFKNKIFNQAINVMAIRTLNKNNVITSGFKSDDEIIIEIEFILKTSIKYLRIGYDLKSSDETLILRTFHNDIKEMKIQTGVINKIRSYIPKNILNTGIYYLDLNIGVHKKGWLVHNLRTLSFHVVLNSINPRYIITKRPGVIVPMLKWKNITI
ncbi:MAG: ATP-binding cassette domain-containing protein, partial [Nanoarchaeota archaeon]|nr:ATP-binding cassette domain-containing protein [Nanoarchaeota archaeon]